MNCIFIYSNEHVYPPFTHSKSCFKQTTCSLHRGTPRDASDNQHNTAVTDSTAPS